MTDIERRLNKMAGRTSSIEDRLSALQNYGQKSEQKTTGLVLPTSDISREAEREQLENDLADINKQQRLLAARTNLARRSRGFTTEDRKAAEEEAAPLREQADDLRHGLAGMDYEDRYQAIDRQDNFGGQFLASYDAGRLGQDEARAWYDYLSNPTEGNRAYAEAVSSARENYLLRNQNALDEDATLPMISQSFAGYLPQFIDQNIAGAKGALAGAAAGSVLPIAGTAAGAKAGFVAGRTLYGYETARGAAFKALLDAGVDEETARSASGDEALLSAILEGGDAVVDMLTLGIGKGIAALVGQPAKAAATSAGRKALSVLGKYGINVASEGAQEWVQEGVSSANAAREGTGALNLIGETAGQIGRAVSGQDPEALARMNQAGIEGMKVAAIMGGASLGGNALLNRVVSRSASGGNIQQENVQTDNRLVLPGNEQNNTASTGETVNENGKRLLQTDTLYKRRTRTTRDTMPGAQESPVPVINAQGEPPQSSSINSILPGGQDVNIQAVSPDSSVGAAPAGFDAYGRLIGKYGAIEPGENPAPHSYAVEVPRQTTANDRVSLSARTIMEAAVTPDAMIPDLAQMVVDGKFSRIPVSNKKSISNAETRIRQVGYQNALMSWIQDVKNGNVSEQTMAMGAVLYNNAATAGDGKTALDIAYYFAQAATQGARATQANRILKMLTPSGQLYMVQKMVNDVNDAVYDSRKNRPGNVPVELWMQRVGENLADELSSRLNVKPMEAKTVAQTILSDLRRYANETAPRRPTSRDTRTEMDRIMDLFQNRAAYEEAWQAAKDTLSDTFENNPDALSTFEAWLDSSLEYTRRLTKELTQQDQIVLPEELADRFLKAETNEARDAVLNEINQYIADQIPSTFLEKFNALRYTNMLGNLKTQIRNVGGNAIMRAVRAGRVKVQAALESAAEKSARRKGREFERTTSATRDKEIYRLAMDEFDQAQAQIMGEQKYSYNGRPIPADIQNRRTIFRVNGTWGTSENSPARLLRRAADLGMSGLEGYRRLTNWSMETGDLLFARSAYADALSRYLKANGVTAEQYQNGTADPELMERARSHAVREAQEATFRDKNAFSDAISSIGFRRPKNNIEHAINMAVQGVLPFRRTPANVAVRAVEYSPLGLIGTVAKEFKRLKGNQNITSNDVISSLAKTLTGSGIMAIGGALGYFGLLTGMEGDDEEQNELNQQSGRQDYALYLPEFITDAVGLPKGFNFTLDWASPMSIPLFMGAELGAEVSKNGIQAKDFFDAIASSSNVLLDMSMLQGVNDQLTNISYSENPLVDLALNSLTDYLQSGFTSTFGGQLERSAEDVRMTTYTDENLELPTDVQYTIGSQLARVPGVDYQQIPYIDAWGREESSGTVLPRTFNQFLNPAYTSSDTATPAIEETQRLYDLTGDGGVVSERPEKEITVNGEEIYLNSGQYLQYATERGQERDRLVSSVIQSQAYQGLSAEDQVSVIKDIYSYTDAVTKSHISDYEPDGWIANVVESGVDPADYILYKHSKQDGMSLKERSELMERSGISGADRTALLLTENPDWAEDAREYGLSEQLYVNFKIATSDVTSDKDENGKTVTNSKKEKIMNIIDQMGVDNDTKDALYYAAGYKESTIDDAPWH